MVSESQCVLWAHPDDDDDDDDYTNTAHKDKINAFVYTRSFNLLYI